MRFSKIALICIPLFFAQAALRAAPIGVTYTVSGSSGNWTLDFTVANNLVGAADQALYLFGVNLSAPNVVGSPASYDPTVYQTWTNSGLGGSSILYNNVWLDATASNLLPGSSLTGFEVNITDAIAPQSVQWFAFTVGSTSYTGGGSFGSDPTNPGFEGVTTPEPPSFAFGLLALASVLRLRRAGRLR